MSTWNMTLMETKFRDLVGMPSTNQISQADVFTLLNDFYVEQLALEIELPEFNSIYSAMITTADSDSGEYTCPDTVIALDQPITIFDSDSDYQGELRLYRDTSLFFSDYPRNPDTDTARPASLLWYGLKFFLRPIADAVYTIDAAVTRKPTTALTSGSDTPLSNSWGPAIAYGTALRKLSDLGDASRIAELAPIYRYHLNLLDAKRISRNIGTAPVPGF